MSYLYWTVGFECVECGCAGDMREDDSESLCAATAIRVLEDDGIINTDSDGRPICPDCSGVATVWWTGESPQEIED